MAEITICKRNCYSGLDADKPASANLGDTYTASDTLKRYTWDGAAWTTGLGYEYVPRRTAAADKGTGDFTTDGAWKVDGLDLSAVVPAGAVAVHIKLAVQDDAVGSRMQIVPNQTDDQSILSVYTQVANIFMMSYATIPIDANRLLDYEGTNLAFTTISLTVLGWYI